MLSESTLMGVWASFWILIESYRMFWCASTYGVHSLGKASISSWVYSLSFLGISLGWGSSSVRLAWMSYGSSWREVDEGDVKGIWSRTQKFKEKREEMGEGKEFKGSDTNKETKKKKEKKKEWVEYLITNGALFKGLEEVFKLGITQRKRKINNQKTPNVQKKHCLNCCERPQA